MFAASLTLVLALPQAGPERTDHPAQDAVAYEISLDVHMEEARVAGHVLYRIAAREDLEEITLDFGNPKDGWEMAFETEAGEALEHTWEEGLLTLPLTAPVKSGEEVVFRLNLSGRPPDGLLFMRNRYGDRVLFSDHYPARVRGWLPCIDNPGDRARFRITLSYPAGYDAIASGTPVPGDPPEPGLSLWQSETEHDIAPYMLTIVVGKYARLVEGGGAPLASHYVYPQDLAKAETIHLQHAAWVDILEQTIGPYPFARYVMVQCPTRWGFFEAPGNVLVSERLFDMGDAVPDVLAHQLVHMWFGNAVGHATWNDIWLGEGFAAYFGAWLREQTGGPPMRDHMRMLRERWLRSVEGRNTPLRRRITWAESAINANLYAKGAWVLHMLRGELGDELFFDTIRDYYTRHKYTAVTSAALVESIWIASGRDLRWFYEQWLNRPGCPELRAKAIDGAIAVEQIQRGSPFRFRLTLQWVDGAGQNHKRVAELHERYTEIPVAGEVNSLVLDPDVELLLRRPK